jgi:hypothetical protein
MLVIDRSGSMSQIGADGNEAITDAVNKAQTAYNDAVAKYGVDTSFEIKRHGPWLGDSRQAAFNPCRCSIAAKYCADSSSASLHSRFLISDS